MIPRNVLIDYLKTMTAFHLSIYIQKLVHVLPKMIKEGKIDVAYDWSIVLDATDNFESKIAKISAADCKFLYNNLHEYMKANFQIGAVINAYEFNRGDSACLPKVFDLLSKRDNEFNHIFKARWTLKKGDYKDDDLELVNELVKYEDSAFDKYIELILSQRTKYLYTKHISMIDTLSFKNDERGMMAQGRSRKHARRFVLGTRLLEALVQILVLESKENQFYTRSLSIEELIEQIRNRYGLLTTNRH